MNFLIKIRWAALIGMALAAVILTLPPKACLLPHSLCYPQLFCKVGSYSHTVSMVTTGQFSSNTNILIGQPNMAFVTPLLLARKLKLEFL